MTKRFIFIDDCPARQRWFATTFIELYRGQKFSALQRYTAVGGIDAIETWKGDGIDFLYLDHDLEPGDDVSSETPSDSKSGWGVVWHLIEHPIPIGQVVVHTMRSDQGKAMCRALANAGYRVKYHSFYKMAHGDLS